MSRPVAVNVLPVGVALRFAACDVILVVVNASAITGYVDTGSHKSDCYLLFTFAF
jgi:hypothetical protein